MKVFRNTVFGHRTYKPNLSAKSLKRESNVFCVPLIMSKNCKIFYRIQDSLPQYISFLLVP